MPQAIDEFEERLRRNVERVVSFELRVRRLSTVFVVRLPPSFSHIFSPELLVRILLPALHAQPVDENFGPEEPTPCIYLSPPMWKLKPAPLYCL